MGIRGKKKGTKMINEIKKYKERGLNLSEIARTMRVSRNTIKRYVHESSLGVSGGKGRAYHAPWSKDVDWPHVLLKKDLGVQLAHYWEQNIEFKLEGVSYLSFWREFRRRYPSIKLDMHQTFTPGQRCEFDYKGLDSGFGYIDSETGEFIQCRLFGMVLPCSQLFFARATLTEKQEDVFDSIVCGFKYFGGVTNTIVFDNAKVQVTRADKYDPDLNTEFSLFCDHYKIAPLAARPSTPKDKSLIENSLGVFWRWAWPQIKVLKINSLYELNNELNHLLSKFNSRTQKKYGLSRQQKFDSNEKIKLRTLPERDYEFGIFKKVKVHPDCHIQVNYNFYSVPYKYRGQELNARINKKYLEVFSGLDRVAIHSLSIGNRGRYFTTKAHLPESHKAILEATPQSVLEDAAAIGDNTHRITERLLTEAHHPLMYLRRIQGILKLKNRYSKESLETGCAFFIDVPISDIKINNIERVISTKRKRREELKVERKSNENLRGLDHWIETYH